MFIRSRFLSAVLFFATIVTVDRHRAGDEIIPVWTMLDDIVQVGHFFEKVVNRDGAILMVVDDNGLPPFVAVESYDVAHTECLLRSSNKSCWIARGPATWNSSLI
jgi:hypothetical protein